MKISMMDVLLKIKMPDNWVRDVSKKFPLPITFIECMPYGKEGGRGLIEIDGTDTDVNEIIEEIHRHPDVCHIDITHLKDGSVLGSIVTDKCVACRILTGSDCFLTSGRSIGDGRVEWHLITGREGSLADLIQKLEMCGCEIELTSTKHLSKKVLLTTRQEEIVQAAFEMGYYDHPKKVTIKDVAERFGISSSTLSEIIQRGERKIMMEHFREKLCYKK
jgi:predicted DNA binding protein